MRPNTPGRVRGIAEIYLPRRDFTSVSSRYCRPGAIVTGRGVHGPAVTGPCVARDGSIAVPDQEEEEDPRFYRVSRKSLAPTLVSLIINLIKMLVIIM